MYTPFADFIYHMLKIKELTFVQMFYEMIRSRRSIRKFKDVEVESSKIDIILNSALLAPSSRSRRPWEFIVVTDKEQLRRLSQCREHSSQFLSGAPLGIVVIADPEACDVWIEDASIAAVIMQLAAHSLGLGSCWIQVRQRFHPDGKSAEEYVKEVLGIPPRYCVECMLAVGYPAEKREPYGEKDLRREKIHHDGF